MKMTANTILNTGGGRVYLLRGIRANAYLSPKAKCHPLTLAAHSLFVDLSTQCRLLLCS